MISAFSGTIWTPMITTTNAARPRKRNFASASAARNASTIDIAVTATTTIRLFRTLDQKFGRFSAFAKFDSVAGEGTNSGVKLRMSYGFLNAVETIQ